MQTSSAHAQQTHASGKQEHDHEQQRTLACHVTMHMATCTHTNCLKRHSHPTCCLSTVISTCSNAHVSLTASPVQSSQAQPSPGSPTHPRKLVSAHAPDPGDRASFASPREGPAPCAPDSSGNEHTNTPDLDQRTCVRTRAVRAAHTWASSTFFMDKLRRMSA